MIAVFQAFAHTVSKGDKGFVVLDTAPTGHALLLLDATQSYHREVAKPVHIPFRVDWLNRLANQIISAGEIHAEEFRSGSPPPGVYIEGLCLGLGWKRGALMKNMLIIGGSDAGISAALRIKELDAQADVTMVLADAYPNFSICGLPFYISGEVQDWHTLAHRTFDEIEEHGIRFAARSPGADHFVGD